MRIGSLFSGIGGLELGLERAGLGPVVWQVEKDPFCRSVLARHWPEAERFEDVAAVGAGELAPVDLICGGFPCQDISLAGKGAGLAGERSGLWWEYARIIRETRPRWVVIENVAALLNRGLDAVLWTLAESGFDAWWDCIPAAAVGAPHRRDRLFVVAWRVSDTERDAVWQQSERGPGRAQAADERNARAVAMGEDVADGDGGGQQVERLAADTIDLYLERFGAHGDHDRARAEALNELSEGLTAAEDLREICRKCNGTGSDCRYPISGCAACDGSGMRRVEAAVKEPGAGDSDA